MRDPFATSEQSRCSGRDPRSPLQVTARPSTQRWHNSGANTFRIGWRRPFAGSYPHQSWRGTRSQGPLPSAAFALRDVRGSGLVHLPGCSCFHGGFVEERWGTLVPEIRVATSPTALSARGSIFATRRFCQFDCLWPRRWLAVAQKPAVLWYSVVTERRSFLALDCGRRVFRFLVSCAAATTGDGSRRGHIGAPESRKP